MTNCDHRHIRSYATEEGEPVNLWACSDCRTRFVPIDREMALDAALRACLRHMHTAGSPEAVPDKAAELLVAGL